MRMLLPARGGAPGTSPASRARLGPDTILVSAISWTADCLSWPQTPPLQHDENNESLTHWDTGRTGTTHGPVLSKHQLPPLIC